ncbi:MAG: diacylglycerol kinase [Sideroxydans sp.]
MKSPHKFNVGLLHVWHATRAAWHGLREAWRHEDAFRQEIAVAAIALPLAFWLPVDRTGKLMLASSILLVLILELVNSAIEAAVDHTSLEQHPLARRAKDVASAAVLLAILHAALVWGWLLLA